MDTPLIARIRAWVPANEDGDVPPPRWPPDLFAVCALLLQESGAYEQIASFANPGLLGERWPDRCRAVARNWLEVWHDPVQDVPDPLTEWWGTLTRSEATLAELFAGNASAECSAILRLLAVADEVCAGVGIESSDEQDPGRNRLLVQALSNLITSHTLTRDLRDPPAVVLPKQHTPQRGLTLRSLSHHLALVLEIPRSAFKLADPTCTGVPRRPATSATSRTRIPETATWRSA